MMFAILTDQAVGCTLFIKRPAL